MQDTRAESSHPVYLLNSFLLRSVYVSLCVLRWQRIHKTVSEFGKLLFSRQTR